MRSQLTPELFMKKLLCSDIPKILFAIVVTLGLARLAVAAEQKDARVTQVVRDVNLLTSRAAARPAALNDAVHEGTAVRTGSESRAELTFADQTLTRLGANTVFSFGQGGKNIELSSGAMLMCVAVKVNTAAATAAVTGFSMLVEAHSKSWTKFIVLEGEACIKLKGQGAGEPCMKLHPGEMLILPPGTRSFTEKQHVNLKKVVQTAGLIKGLGKLPKWAWNPIVTEVDNQQHNPPPQGGYSDPTGTDARDQKASTVPLHTPPPITHGSPPG